MSRDSLEIRSTIIEEGKLVLSLENATAPAPGPDEVTVRIEAAPINPSDLFLLLGPADRDTFAASGTHERPVLTAEVPAGLMRLAAARLGKPMRVGNEGAGVVVATGESGAARALMGKTVGVIGGAMYAQYRTVHLDQCLAFPEGTVPADCASWFVNPLTVLGMVETMRREGHSALVHTAAASNLGQMLQRVCTADGIELVNIVRRPGQEELLRSIGAKQVVNSESKEFMKELMAAVAATGATLAFDAIGGGKLASRILTAMEAAQSSGGGYSAYGSSIHKQVYIYGGLDFSPTVLTRNHGLAWGVGGWLLMDFLQKAGHEETERLKARVAREIKTTFASKYAKEISLAEALSPEAAVRYAKQATGEKYLINPNREEPG
jgi:NADPH:quinone reductase-like Zn-dependent oxidoreductase